jgi:hypothetical protein
LELAESGKAIITLDKRDQVQGDFTETTTLDFRITGDKIEIGCFHPYPANVLCPSFTGTISGLRLNLVVDPNQPLVYHYFSPSM